jgi:PDZ domain-containing secreted protein
VIEGDVTISPKLIIKPFGYNSNDICELEEARHRLNFDDAVILVDGKRVRTYDELVQMVVRDNYKDKEFIDVVLLPLISGG